MELDRVTKHWWCVESSHVKEMLFACPNENIVSGFSSVKLLSHFENANQEKKFIIQASESSLCIQAESFSG